mmetsp:Transcript_51032/g.95483  ORF Transcript_51032/g.95483 Transcript_51032/m.95483 type:complete len:551 (-) Transcript_51032:130-1782(-)
MAGAEEDNFLVAFKALAVVHKQVEADGSKLVEALEELEPREKRAIRDFQQAAQECLGQLKGWTLLALENLGLDAEPPAKRRHVSRPSLCVSYGDEQSICKNFEKFDSDKDGILNVEEYSKALVELSEGAINDDNARKLLDESDVCSDGKIPIKEFIVWLYGEKKEEEKTEEDESKASSEELEKLRAEISELQLELRAKRRALDAKEDEHEAEIEATHDFWKSIAEHAVLTIEKKVDLENATWLGNGKYGFVLKATRRKDDRELVVKMMGIRWTHLAVKEWKSGIMCGKHQNIVEIEDVMLHADDDKSIQKLLTMGYETGALKSKKKRSKFPDRYICITQEFMNRGTVQDWIDKDCLLPGGEFVVMQKVAAALWYMHERGVTHNDIKPENILLHQVSDDKVVVKLGDLGLATTSKEVKKANNDFWQYGMTAFCMIIGERFGTRKYRAEGIPEMCKELEEVVEDSGSEGKLLATYEDMPELLTKVFPADIDFKRVRDWPSLQRWDFFEGGDAVDKAPETNPIARARHRKTLARGHTKLTALENLTIEHACAM